MPDDYFRRYSPADIFGNAHPLEIDLGCGDGKFLLEMAEHYPERNFIGVERLLGRVRGVCRQIEERKLSNAKVLRLESQYTLEWLLEPGSVSRLHLLCPDPWPKARHHKRRLVQEPFLTALHQALASDGEFLFKTDHPDYYEWVCEEMDQFNQNTTRYLPLDWPEPPSDHALFYPKTDFQLHWESQGKKIHRLRYRVNGKTAN
ncbi:tRNA (guanosine(46)-N7)-methyltransferase TrmB [Verrucomicrobiaceae bacterium N1E253]|uniref:tRNA (guanine-N(7)-)-methyltransferase n=2 Tax=Oceaniferula marina TaxID=2748318 RepID=A0A851GJX7_9BACT|nr:tRNA (guanosine(46)-N7)-methyltransferase TrmB [Oceaniferula marina]